MLFKYENSLLINYITFYLVIAPRVGLEPTTPRLTAVCSTIELSRIIKLFTQINLANNLMNNL